MNTTDLVSRIIDEAIAENRITRDKGQTLTRKQVSEFSLARVLTDLSRSDRRLGDGIEKDINQQTRHIGEKGIGGCFIPFDIGTSPHYTRDMYTGDFGGGGALVATNMSSSVIPLLRNKTSAIRLGATVIDKLTGNFILPRQTAATTATALGEIAPVQASQPAFDQIECRPRRISAKVVYSRQMVLQSGIGIEAYLRRELWTQISLTLDRYILNGIGANSEPLGLLNTPGIGSVNFGGMASLSSLIAFEQSLAAADADLSTGSLAYLTTPAVRSRWKQIAEVGVNTSGSVVPVMLWQNGSFNDGSNDGMANGYRAATSNNVPNNQVIYGCWPELLVCLWGNGIDMVVDPYTASDSDEIKITAHMYADVALQHPQSFAASADSGSQ